MFRLLSSQKAILFPALATSTTVAAKSFVKCEDTKLSIHSTPTTETVKKSCNLKTRMTSIGRFALQSETKINPSIPTFFVALTNPTTKNLSDTQPPLDFNSLEELWSKKKIFEKQPRFQYSISSDSLEDGYFLDDSNNKSSGSQKSLSKYVKESTFHYKLYRNDLRYKIEQWLSNNETTNNKLNLKDQLWQGYISSGVLGSSGAISNAKVREIQKNSMNKQNLQETIVLFRAHHVMADGVSLASFITELSDEAKELEEKILFHIKSTKEKKEKLTFLQKILKFCYIWIFGTTKALLEYVILMLKVPTHPFHQLLQADLSNEEKNIRSVSWCDVAPVKEANEIAKLLSQEKKKATINDLFVSCVSAAVIQQLKEFQRSCTKAKVDKIPSSLNVVMPVHLRGGVILPGKSMGNHIGAMVVNIPTLHNSHNKLEKELSNEEALQRLSSVSKTLQQMKQTPMPFLSYGFAKFCSYCLPHDISTYFMSKANANAAFVVSNVRGTDHLIHWNQRPVQSVVGFLPLPPGIPIGVVVGSYNGMITLSLTADRRVVPDPDRFLSWILFEYARLYDEAQKIKNNNNSI